MTVCETNSHSFQENSHKNYLFFSHWQFSLRRYYYVIYLLLWTWNRFREVSGRLIEDKTYPIGLLFTPFQFPQENELRICERIDMDSEDYKSLAVHGFALQHGPVYQTKCHKMKLINFDCTAREQQQKAIKNRERVMFVRFKTETNQDVMHWSHGSVVLAKKETKKCVYGIVRSSLRYQLDFTHVPIFTAWVNEIIAQETPSKH